MNTLKVVLSDHWFDEIKSGRKTHEYRKATPYWQKRLKNAFRDWTKPAFIEFQRAYRKNPERMTFRVTVVVETDGEKTDLKCHERVFEIWLGERVK